MEVPVGDFGGGGWIRDCVSFLDPGRFLYIYKQVLPGRTSPDSKFPVLYEAGTRFIGSDLIYQGKITGRT